MFRHFRQEKIQFATDSKEFVLKKIPLNEGLFCVTDDHYRTKNN